MFRIAVVITAVAALTACNPVNPANPVADELSMQSYAVPDGYAPELVGTLNRLLRAHTDAPIGRAERGPRGEVIVVAPASVQAGVAAMAGGLGTGPTPEPPDNIAIEYWIFTGTPAAETTIDPRLGEVRAALDAIVGVDGPMRFEPVNTQTLRALSGDEAQIETGTADSRLSLRQVASREPISDAIVADIHLDLWSGRVRSDTRLALRPDQTVVLSEVGNLSTQEGEWATLYTVIRPRVTPAG